MYATFNRFEIRMTLAQAQQASHPEPDAPEDDEEATGPAPAE